MRRARCYCGAVRFSLEGEPDLVCLCHCAQCRAAVGAGPVAWATYRRERVALQRGAAHWFSSSAHARRGFCQRCGTSLFFESSHAPDTVDVCVAAMEEGPAPMPSCHIFVLDRSRWSTFDDGLPCHLADADSPRFDPRLHVRSEAAEDRAAVWRIHERAFGRRDEAAIVESLRAAGALTLSLVAAHGDELMGHVAFSPVTLDRGPDAAPGKAIGLGPVAVLPEHQRRAIGTRLIGEGLARLRQTGHAAVVVLGHSAYYERFGFGPARRFGLTWEHDAPPDAFMALELTAGGLQGPPGVVRYRPELGGPS